MTALRSQLTELAQSFVESVLAAMKGTSVEEFLGTRTRGNRATSVPAGGAGGPTPSSKPRRGKPGRLPRRSPDDVARALDLVTKLVKAQPKGLRAEEIRKKLGLDVREMPRILKEGVAKKKLRTKGRKRATTYFAV
jgi:hypothetical protein